MTELSPHSKSVDHFWSILEKETGAVVPKYIKHLFRFNNLDNAVSIKKVFRDTFTELEAFARDVMPHVLDADVNLNDYYGIFAKCTEKFQFVTGDKTLILQLVETAKKIDAGKWLVTSKLKLGSNSDEGGPPRKKKKLFTVNESNGADILKEGALLKENISTMYKTLGKANLIIKEKLNVPIQATVSTLDVCSDNGSVCGTSYTASIVCPV